MDLNKHLVAINEEAISDVDERDVLSIRNAPICIFSKVTITATYKDQPSKKRSVDVTDTINKFLLGEYQNFCPIPFSVDGCVLSPDCSFMDLYDCDHKLHVKSKKMTVIKKYIIYFLAGCPKRLSII